MKLKTLIVCLLMSALILIGVQVYAAEGTITMSGATEAKPGDTVTVTINVGAKSDGISGFVCDFSYPQDVLTLTYFGDSIPMQGVLLHTFDTSLKTGENGTITLKFLVNANTDAKEAVITLGDAKLTDDDKTEVSVGTVSHKITLETQDEDPTDNPKDEPTDNPKEEPKQDEPKQEEPKQEEPKQEISNKPDTTTAKTSTPKAGLEIITVPGIIGAIIIAIVSHKRYKNTF